MQITIDGKHTWVNYHHLYCFYVIATSGGLSKAAVTLGIGQSALSIQMRQFERALDFSLFDRSPGKLVPNERGRLVLGYAKEIFRLGEEMVETISNQPTANRTHLKIGALDTIPKHLTVQIVKKALSEMRCTLSVIESAPSILVEGLLKYRIDLLLTNFVPAMEPNQIYAKRIARRQLWVVGAAKYQKLKRGFPKSLGGQPFVVPTSDSRVRHEIESFCKMIKITPDFLAETQDIMVQKLLAIDGVGLTVMPQYAVQEYLHRKELFLIGPLKHAFEELFLVAASRKVENPVARFLMNYFRLE